MTTLTVWKFDTADGADAMPSAPSQDRADLTLF